MLSGVKLTVKDIKEGFKKAFTKPWPERLRYEVQLFLPLVLLYGIFFY